MKNIFHCLIAALLCMASSCPKNDEPKPDDEPCEQHTSIAGTIVHSYDDFMDNTATAGDAAYSHIYIEDAAGISTFIINANIINVCKKSNVSIDLTNIVTQANMTHVGSVDIGAISPTVITMTDVGGVVSGEYVNQLNESATTTMYIENKISFPYQGSAALDSAYYNTYVDTHGITITFQNPK